MTKQQKTRSVSSDNSDSNLSEDESKQRGKKSSDRKKRYTPNCKCKFCGTIFLNAQKTADHEENCGARKSANIFITFDGKMKFVCTVSLSLIYLFFVMLKFIEMLYL